MEAKKRKVSKNGRDIFVFAKAEIIDWVILTANSDSLLGW